MMPSEGVSYVVLRTAKSNLNPEHFFLKHSFYQLSNDTEQLFKDVVGFIGCWDMRITCTQMWDPPTLNDATARLLPSLFIRIDKGVNRFPVICHVKNVFIGDVDLIRVSINRNLLGRVAAAET